MKQLELIGKTIAAVEKLRRVQGSGIGPVAIYTP